MFQCPADTLIVFAQVLYEYRLESLPAFTAPAILDIGANVGAFCWAALRQYPDARIIAFEPHPTTCALLRSNVAEWNVEVHERAVVHPVTSETVRLFDGKNATTEASIRNDLRWPHVSQDLEKWHDVRVIDASTLPPCDILKLDPEGSEVEILEGYRHLRDVKVLLVEVHAVGGDLKAQTRRVMDLAAAAGFAPLDVYQSTIRFIKPELAAGQAVVVDGEWAIVETTGGTWRFGQIQEIDKAAGEITLKPGFECSPSRIIMPVAPAGHPISVSYVDLPDPYIWNGFNISDGSEITVRYSSIRRLPAPRASQILAHAKTQSGATA